MPDARRTIEILINSRFDGKGTQEAVRGLSSVQGIISGVARGLVTSGTAIVGTLTGIALASGRAADGLRDIAIRSNQQIEFLSQVGYVADQTGTNVTELADGLKFLNRNADDAARGSEEAAKKFARVGVSVTDANGRLKDSKTLLFETSDGLRAIRNDGERAAATLDLFGRSGDRLTEFLGLGSQGIQRMIGEAARLGATVSPEVAGKADDFGDALKRTRTATGGLGLAIADVLLPKLTVLADRLTEVILKGAEFVRQNPELVDAAAKFGTVAVAGGSALAVTAQIASIIGGIKNGLSLAQGPAKALMQTLSGGAAAVNLANIAKQLALIIGLPALAAGAIVIPAHLAGENKRKKENREDRITASFDDPEIQGLVRDRDQLRAENKTYLHDIEREQNNRLLEGIDELIDKRLELLETERKAGADKSLEEKNAADLKAIEALEQGVAAGQQAARDLEARAKLAGRTPALQLEFEQSEAEMKKLQDQLDRLTAPDQRRKIEVEIALKGRSAENLRLLEHVARDQFEKTGQVDPRILNVLEQARRSRLTEKERDTEDFGTIVKPALKPRPEIDRFGHRPEADVPELQAIDPVDPFDGESPIDPETGGIRKSAAAIAEAQAQLKDLSSVGVAAAENISGAFRSWLHTIVETGDGLEDLGKILLKSLAFTGVDLATGGIFKAIGGIFKGLAEGGTVGPTGRIHQFAEGATITPAGKVHAYAQGGIVSGRGSSGIDSVLAAVSPGEIIMPPTLSRIFQNLAGLDQPALATNLGGGSRTYQINVSPLTGSHHEALEFARRVRHAMRELDGEFVR